MPNDCDNCRAADLLLAQEQRIKYLEQVVIPRALRGEPVEVWPELREEKP